MKELAALKKWLKDPENKPIKLAEALGYLSATTVNNWIKRGRIPKNRVQQAMKFITTGKGPNE